jgi:hypothetical protein
MLEGLGIEGVGFRVAVSHLSAFQEASLPQGPEGQDDKLLLLAIFT